MIPLALALVFGSLFFQALPWPEAWRAHKPWSCPTCQIGWSILSYTFSPWWRSEDHLTVLAAGGLALVLLALVGWLKGPPLVPPSGP